MNIFSQFKENILVGAGSATGLTVGMGANLPQSRSLFGKSFSACSKKNKNDKALTKLYKGERLINTTNDMNSLHSLAISEVRSKTEQENTLTSESLVSFRNQGWTISGVAIGILLGSGTNYLKSGSLFWTNMSEGDEFNNIPFFGNINNWRENEFEFFTHRLRTRVIPFFPIFHLTPMLILTIWNTFNQKNSAQYSKNKKLADLTKDQLSENILYPYFNTIATSCAAYTLRYFTDSYFSNHGIDPSGHIIAQSLIALHSLNFSKGITKNGTLLQKNFFSVLCAGMAITDAIWTYNTASNCHSVADVVTGIAFPIFAYFGVKKCKEWAISGWNTVNTPSTKAESFSQAN